MQLPGRQNRIAEPPITDVPRLLKMLSHALRSIMNGSFALFEHSGGAVLAYELARALRDSGAPEPAHLFLSAQPAPEAAGRVRRLHDLSDRGFAAELVRFGGIEPYIAENEYVMADLLPTVRADFRLRKAIGCGRGRRSTIR